MTGALIQSSRMNKRLRMFFAFPAAREMLRRLDEEPQLGMEVRVHDRNADPVNRFKSREGQGEMAALRYGSQEDHVAFESAGTSFRLFPESNN